MKSVRKPLFSAVAVLALAIGAAGCSSGDKEEVVESGPVVEETQSEESGAPAEDEAAPETETSDTPELYTSADDGFSIAFPGEPAISPLDESTPGVAVKGNMYIDEVNAETVYMVSVSTVTLEDPNASWDVDGAIQGGLTGMSSSVGGTNVQEELGIEVQGIPGGKTTFQVTQGDTTLDFQALVLVDQFTSYQIATIGTSEADFQKFVDSFVVNK